MTATPPRPGAGRNASPYLYGTEHVAVAEVLASGHYGHTSVVEEFEDGVARLLDVPDAIAVSSGTAALHLALLVAGVTAGQEVVVPSLTFCATIQAILHAGARPRFAEVNPDTLCMDAPAVLDALTDTTAAVLPVLYGGRAVDLSSLDGLLAERGITVVEDAAHAFGSHQGPKRVGATGRLTCFSFGPIKNLTCGQGGAIIPRTREEAYRLRHLRLLGVVESASQRAASTAYQVTEPGAFRYQMSAINAAIGSTQLAHFATAESVRRHLWRTYRTALSGIPGVALVDVDVDHCVPHLAVVRVPDRDGVWRFMREQGVAVGVHYPPNHTQHAFKAWHRPLPVTERLGGEIMTLPFHQHLTGDDIRYVASTLQLALDATGVHR
ncbi:UDP-4-amino-4-deoxy-L-arabinose--oxoglutarate aminotransferase [Streptomyces hundungensis]|uniref:UDP-4-amino-4-deoxy-L-arabinose--oxoglutarate aminotransferase n=1 Tax=Streptomyces hundungensis TaxID=1077946 RepID=A0A387H6X6_9ACTN|nr:DegT/DnrJ/EryC1/StrS family aminotransferase [Streptomyces hundungensis]AYG77933.1 UDP-4-amino-4-deoxy-L-arabinose--oxoglutarate aminotransferase [Streptomyces hundungensis]